MRNTTKRTWMAAAALLIAGFAGACADQPMAPQDEAYEVQMEETTPPNNNCIYIDGQLHCKS